MGEFADQVFRLELIRCSLDEICVSASKPYSSDQLVAHRRADELADKVIQFLLHEASSWGVSEEVLQLGVHSRWKEYGDEIGDDGSEELEAHKRFLEQWLPKSIGHFPGSEVLH